LGIRVFRATRTFTLHNRWPIERERKDAVAIMSKSTGDNPRALVFTLGFGIPWFLFGYSPQRFLKPFFVLIAAQLAGSLAELLYLIARVFSFALFVHSIPQIH
jgi:hypothetical protein